MAGTLAGRNSVSRKMKSMYEPASIRLGVRAPRYMSPTDTRNWSARMISTSDGGMIWASVPEAAMTPVATRVS